MAFVRPIAIVFYISVWIPHAGIGLTTVASRAGRYKISYLATSCIFGKARRNTFQGFPRRHVSPLRSINSAISSRPTFNGQSLYKRDSLFAFAILIVQKVMSVISWTSEPQSVVIYKCRPGRVYTRTVPIASERWCQKKYRIDNVGGHIS